MRILLACPYAWDVPGGVQGHVRGLAEALRSHGHRVEVVAPTRTARSTESAVAVGRTIGVPWGGAIAPICFSRRSLQRLRTRIATFAPDVVHVHEPLAPSTGLLTAIATTAPLVATFHAFSERTYLVERWGRALESIAQRIVAPIAVSHAAAACAHRAIGRAPTVIPNGIDTARFGRRRTPSAGPVLLWVHRLDRRKGFPIALRAFGTLAARFDDLRLVVVGDGPDRRALSLIPERFRHRVDLRGTIPDVALPACHADATVFVASATGGESFGVALVEAMAAGLPVVASDIPGYREVATDGREGLLVPPGDPTALATALARVLTSPRLATDLGHAGRRRARLYDWRTVAPRIEAEYARATGRDRRAYREPLWHTARVSAG